jgi:uncharacterized protein YdbL (DUF1318 family)
VTKEDRKTLAEFILNNPQYTYPQIAAMTNLAHSTIARVAGEFNIHRANTGKRMPLVITLPDGSEVR